MRPSSFNHSKSEDELDYEKEVEKRKEGYRKELSEIISKIRGGSLEAEDKKDCLKCLIQEIAESNILTKKEILVFFVDENF